MPKNRDILLSVMVSLDVTFSNPGERAIRHKTLKRVLNKTIPGQAAGPVRPAAHPRTEGGGGEGAAAYRFSM